MTRGKIATIGPFEGVLTNIPFLAILRIEFAGPSDLSQLAYSLTLSALIIGTVREGFCAKWGRSTSQWGAVPHTGMNSFDTNWDAGFPNQLTCIRFRRHPKGRAPFGKTLSP